MAKRRITPAEAERAKQIAAAIAVMVDGENPVIVGGALILAFPDDDMRRRLANWLTSERAVERVRTYYDYAERLGQEQAPDKER